MSFRGPVLIFLLLSAAVVLTSLCLFYSGITTTCAWNLQTAVPGARIHIAYFYYKFDIQAPDCFSKIEVSDGKKTDQDIHVNTYNNIYCLRFCLSLTQLFINCVISSSSSAKFFKRCILNVLRCVSDKLTKTEKFNHNSLACLDIIKFGIET